MVSGRPMASKEKSKPSPPVRLAFRLSSSSGLQAWVAPNRLASSSFPSLRSTATMAGGAGDLGALDAGDADAAAAEHDDRAARRDLGGVDGGADAGHHAAADEAADLERDVVVDLHDALVRDDHLLGEGAGTGHAEHRRRRRG